MEQLLERTIATWENRRGLDAEIETILEHEGVLSLRALSQRVGLRPDDTRQRMQDLCQRSRIECLQPARSNTMDPELIYYRWSRDSDGDYLWELKQPYWLMSASNVA